MKLLNTLIILILFSNISCAQNIKKETSKTKTDSTMYTIENYLDEESKQISKDNFVYEINKNIKRYTKEPVYYLRINKQNCIIDLLVNDVRRLKDYELSNYITPIRINSHILTSGEQTVTVRMYPVGDLINKSLGKEGPFIDTLLPNSSVSVSVIKVDNKSEKKLSDEVLITQNISPTANGKFLGSGLSYYEYSFTFLAEVPYELEGWTKGQDLRKLDQKKLEQKALEFYEMVQQIYENKDIDAWLKLNFSNIKSFHISTYDNEIDYLESNMKRFQYDYKALPIELYKLRFEGNGKILSLISTNPDPFFKGVLALGLEYIDEDGDEATLFPSIRLYLPEGRSLDDGLMMWK